MSVNTIELQAPYALRVEQNLLDQAPFNQIITAAGGNDHQSHQSLRTMLLLLRDIDLPKLEPDILICNSPRIQSALTRLGINPVNLEQMMRLLDPYPNYLKYLKNEPGIAYDMDGSWIKEHLSGRGDGSKIEYGPMYTARSYGFWISMRQRLPAPDEERDNTLTDADVTALLRRYQTIYLEDGIREVKDISCEELTRRQTILYTPRTWKIAVL